MDTLGVDIGGVIINRVNDDTDTSFFGDNYLATTATPGVFWALAQLVVESSVTGFTSYRSAVSGFRASP